MAARGAFFLGTTADPSNAKALGDRTTLDSSESDATAAGMVPTA